MSSRTYSSVAKTDTSTFVGDKSPSFPIKPSNLVKKRKSDDIIEINNSENISPNVKNSSNNNDVKKLRFQPTTTTALSISSSTSSLIQPKIRSGLPRYNKVTAPVSTVAEKKKIATEHSTNERTNQSVTPAERMLAGYNIPITPSKDKNISNHPKTPTTSSKLNVVTRLQKLQASTSDKLRDYFDNAFTTTDEKITEICSNLKVKSKWDIKEKCKKQELVIKELKDSLVLTLKESSTLKSKCCEFENSLTSVLKDAQYELDNNASILATSKATETRLKKDLLKNNEETRILKETLLTLKNDALEASEMKQKLEIQEKLRIEANKQVENLETNLCKTQEESTKLIESIRNDAQKTIDIAKEEALKLKLDLTKNKAEVEKTLTDKADIESKSSKQREELFQCMYLYIFNTLLIFYINIFIYLFIFSILDQSQLKTIEQKLENTERESKRNIEDLESVKAQLLQKDIDFRSTLNSLNEVQRQSAEDKGGLRAELNSIQSRVRILEEERLKITSELATAKSESLASIKEDAKLRETIALLESKVQSRDSEILLAKEGLLQLEVEKELLSRCEIREEGERRERIAACAQLLAVQTECNHRIQMLENSNKQKFEELKKEYDHMSNLRDEAIIESRKQADLVMGMESEVRQYKNALENASESQEAVEKVGKLTGEIEILRRRLNEITENKEHDVEKYSNKIDELTEQVKASEVQRRKLHNIIQELRGNVRVFARVRPFLPNDGLDLSAAPEPSISVWPDGTNLKITKVCTEKERPEDFTFGFDRVFGPSISQESVFTEVSEFVQSALDGYNVCLFSYGQTGSGKTHTMQGSGSGTMRGIIPRAMQQVGQYKTELEVKGWEYEMEVSFIEIYNETIRDLLRSEKTSNVVHEIKKDANGVTYITDVTKIPVDPNNTEQMDGISELAARHRSVAQTAMNERSSRSHSIFALHLKATNKLQGIVLNGTLSLVDLAGSERIDRSGATGDRLKESVAINKSLSSLADVFVALGNKQTHVPFRNSKLTYLLQPALSGDGKTLMMVNLSPTDESYFESLCSLRFAKQVNQCELGKPKRQLDSISSTPESSKLATTATTKRLAATSTTSSSSTPLRNVVAKKKL